eukprot:83112_1
MKNSIAFINQWKAALSNTSINTSVPPSIHVDNNHQLQVENKELQAENKELKDQNRDLQLELKDHQLTSLRDELEVERRSKRHYKRQDEKRKRRLTDSGTGLRGSIEDKENTNNKEEAKAEEMRNEGRAQAVNEANKEVHQMELNIKSRKARRETCMFHHTHKTQKGHKEERKTKGYKEALVRKKDMIRPACKERDTTESGFMLYLGGCFFFHF